MHTPTDCSQTNNKKWLCYGEAHYVSPETLRAKRRISEAQSMTVSEQQMNHEFWGGHEKEKNDRQQPANTQSWDSLSVFENINSVGFLVKLWALSLTNSPKNPPLFLRETQMSYYD